MRCKFETEPKQNIFELILDVQTNAEDPEMYLCNLMEAIHRNCMYTIKTGKWDRVLINGNEFIQARIIMETESDLHSEKEAERQVIKELETEFEFFCRWRKKYGHEETSVIDQIGIETAEQKEEREKKMKEEEELEKEMRAEIRARENWKAREKWKIDEMAMHRQYQEMQP